MSFANDTTKPKPRLLTVSYSTRNLRKIILCGGWLIDWGFNIGDRMSLHFHEVGNIHVSTGTDLDFPAVIADQLNEPLPLYPPSNRVSEDARSYRLYASTRETPKIMLTGAWLRKWGFTIGDQIQLTQIRKGYFQLQVTVTANDRYESQRKKELEQDASEAITRLIQHRHDHPELYEQGKKPSVYEQIMTANREYHERVAVRRFGERLA